MPITLFVLRLICAVSLLTLLPPGRGNAGPPDGVSGRMALDMVADGLRKYKAIKSPDKKALWLSQLARTGDVRVELAAWELFTAGRESPAEADQILSGEGYYLLRVCEKILPRGGRGQDQAVTLVAVGERNCVPCYGRWRTTARWP